MLSNCMQTTGQGIAIVGNVFALDLGIYFLIGTKWLDEILKS